MVMPDQKEVVFEEPELIRHGSKYGVNIKAHAPSIHMIQANIETEIAPIVGTQEQAEDRSAISGPTDGRARKRCGIH